MTGNLWEWNDLVVDLPPRVLRSPIRVAFVAARGVREFLP